jgi:hypothetical protein
MPMAARDLISGSPEQIEAMFPKLDDIQVAGLAGFGQQRDAQPHAVILERGDLHHGIFVVLSGRVECFALLPMAKLFSTVWVAENSPAT